MSAKLTTRTRTPPTSYMSASVNTLEIDQAQSSTLPLTTTTTTTTTTPDAIHRTDSDDIDDEQQHAISMDPHAMDGGGGGDLTSAVLGIVKAMVGPAILYLPHGFAKAGYLVALPIMGVATLTYLHSSQCLLDVWRWESKVQLVPQQDDDENDNNNNGETLQPYVPQNASRSTRSLSYADLAHRAFGTRGETVVKVGIALMQSGVCLTYLIFVPHNLQTSLKLLLGIRLPTFVYLFVMVLMQIPLSWIRDISKFTTTNALANGLILYGLLLCLWFALGASTQPLIVSEAVQNTTFFEPINATVEPEPQRRYLQGTEESQHGPVGNVWQHLTHLAPWGDDWILFIGTSVLLFEGSITLLIPLQEAVQPNESNDRERFPLVYPQVILAIQAFYFFFAITCWMGFGDHVNTVLTTSLPETFLATTVQLAYSVAVLFTFPLQNYPALEIACHSIAEQWRTHSDALTAQFGIPPWFHVWFMKRNSIAACLVCLQALVALSTMNSLDKVVSLTGALIGIPIAFIIPPLIHIQLVPNLSRTRIYQNYAVSILGVGAMVLASVTTILEWND